MGTVISKALVHSESLSGASTLAFLRELLVSYNHLSLCKFGKRKERVRSFNLSYSR